MSRRPPQLLIRRARADADLVEAIDHDLAESVAAAPGFVDALEAAYTPFAARRRPARHVTHTS